MRNWVELTKRRIKGSYYSVILSHTAGGSFRRGQRVGDLSLVAQLCRLEWEINPVVSGSCAGFTCECQEDFNALEVASIKSWTWLICSTRVWVEIHVHFNHLTFRFDSSQCFLKSTVHKEWSTSAESQGSPLFTHSPTCIPQVFLNCVYVTCQYKVLLPFRAV